MSGAPARPTATRRFHSIWNAAAPVDGTHGAAYLAGRGIDPHPSVRWLARADWDAAGLSYELAPTRNSRGPDLGPGTEVAASHGYPADVAGVLVYAWTDPAGDLHAIELEGITHGAERRDYIRRNGDRAKRWAVTGSRFGAAGLFFARPIRIGGRVHVCEGAPDALSLPALAAAGRAELRPNDAVIGVHGSRDLPKLAPLLGVHDTLIYPHMLDTHGDGERFSGELAAAVGPRAVIVRVPAGKGDLNSVLTGKVEAAAAAVSGAGGRPPTLSGAEFLDRALQPDDVELVPDAPGLAYRSRAVLVHADRGEGKTTYAANVTVRATRAGLRVLLAVDDDPRSWAARLVGFGADPELFRVAEMRDLAASGALEREAQEHDITVIDSWRRWLRASSRDAGRAGAANDESIVGAVADRFVEVAHAGPAVVMLTNQAKAPDARTARGSVALEDSVDAVREVVKVDDVTTIREAGKTRHGIPVGPWHMRLEGDGFTPSTDGGSGGGISIVNGEAVDHRQQRMNEAIDGYLMAHPEGVTINAAKAAITGRGADVARRVKAVGERGVDGLWRAAGPERVPAASPIPWDSPDSPSPEASPALIPIGRTRPDSPSPEASPDPTYREPRTRPDSPSPDTESRTRIADSTSATDHGFKTPVGDHPEGGSDVTEAQTTTAAEQPTAEQPDHQPTATAQDLAAVVDAGQDDQPLTMPVGGDVGAVAGAVPADDLPGDAGLSAAHGRVLTMAEVDAVMDPDALWYRKTPGYPELGEQVVLPGAGGVVYLRRLHPVEAEQERAALMAEVALSELQPGDVAQTWHKPTAMRVEQPEQRQTQA